MNYIKQLTDLKKLTLIAETGQNSKRKTQESKVLGGKNELLFLGWGIKPVRL